MSDTCKHGVNKLNVCQDCLREKYGEPESPLAPAGSVVWGSCPIPNHAFAIAGKFQEGKVPDGYPCLCGQTVARWKKCDMGHEHLVTESLPPAQDPK